MGYRLEPHVVRISAAKLLGLLYCAQILISSLIYVNLFEGRSIRYPTQHITGVIDHSFMWYKLGKYTSCMAYERAQKL